MFSVELRGSFEKTESFLRAMTRLNIKAVLNHYGQEGVQALSGATPVETGRAASAWGYEITVGAGFYSINWFNNDVESGFPVAIMVQLGYGTGTGGFVHGRDYINPAMRPIFDRIADDVWKAVISA